MTDGHPGNSQPPPDVSGVFFLPEMVKVLGEPVFARFGERLAAGEEARILAAIAAVPRRAAAAATPEAVQEVIRREVLARVLAARVVDLRLSADVVARDLVRARAQLDAMREGSRPKRVYYAMSALHRCATRAQEREVVAASCRALEMPRNRVDVYKHRALQSIAAETCFAHLDGSDGRDLLGELHLFFVEIAPALGAAAAALLDAYCRPGDALGAASTLAAHQEQNRLRALYNQRCKQAKSLWTTVLPAALDASRTRPIDVEAELTGELERLGLSPEQVRERVAARWLALRIHGSLPNRLLPTSTWRPILKSTPRPPTSSLEGEWRQLVRGKGIDVENAWRRVLDVAREADVAHDAWDSAAERSFMATQGDPAVLKAAMKHFNKSLDELLMRPAGARTSS